MQRRKPNAYAHKAAGGALRRSLAGGLTALLLIALLAGCSGDQKPGESTVSGEPGTSQSAGVSDGTNGSGGQADSTDPTGTNGTGGSGTGGNNASQGGNNQSGGNASSGGSSGGSQGGNSGGNQGGNQGGGQTTTTTNKNTSTDGIVRGQGSYDEISPAGIEAGKGFVSLNDVKKDTVTGAGFTYFVFQTDKNAALPYNIACYLTGSTITAVVPSGVNLTRLVADFGAVGTATAGGITLQSGKTVFDLSKPVTISVKGTGGAERTYTLAVQALNTGLPSVAVTTKGMAAIESKQTYVQTEFYVGGGDKSVCWYGGVTPQKVTGQIKGRGNTSWEHPKKNYTLELDKEFAVFDMHKSRHWVLNGNYEDQSLMRNTIAAQVSEAVGCAYTMQVRPVDLWLNGQYWGTYDVIEKIEIEKERVNIARFAANKAPNQVGYLLEFDRHVTEPQHYDQSKVVRRGEAYYNTKADELYFEARPGSNYWITVKDPNPDEMKDTHIAYIMDVVGKAYDAVKTRDYNQMNKYMDVESFVKWFVVEEFMNNVDAAMHSSVYMTLDAGGKLRLGPVWDFDRSSGNCSYMPANMATLYEKQTGWFPDIFGNATARSMLKKEWTAFSGKWSSIDAKMTSMTNMLEKSQEFNFEKWDTFGEKLYDYMPDEVTSAFSHQAQVDVLRRHLRNRQSFLGSYISSR